MSSVTGTLKRMKIWQMAAIAAVLLVGAGSVYAFSNGGSGQSDENQQLVPVRAGDVANEVAISGSIRFPNQAALGFGIQGTVGEVFVTEGDMVEEGQPLARLDAVTVTSLQKSHAQAQLSLESAQAAADEAMAGSEEAQEQYRRVFEKWFGVWLTEEQLIQPPSAILKSWDVSLTDLFGNGRFSDISQGWFAAGLPHNDPATPWDESVVYTWTNLTPGDLMATCNVNSEIQAGSVCVQKELELAWKQVLDATGNPLTTTILQADLTLAHASLTEAAKRLEGAVIIAPISGMITAVNAYAGSSVSANAAVVEIVDLTVAEVDGRVDERDVLSLHVGMPVRVTMDALGSQALQGTISYIAPSATEQQGVVRYPLRVRIDVPQGMQLRQGLSATARVTLSGEENVLLVPLQAVGGSFLQPTVQVLNGNRKEERPVTLGADDGFWVAVHDGVTEGEQVVMRGAATSAGAISPTGRQAQGGQFQIPGLTPGAGAGGSGGLQIDPGTLDELRRQFQQGGGGGQGGGAGQGGGRFGGGQ